MSVIRARTARKPHYCTGCHWTPSRRGTTTIFPGHRYLIHTAYPGYTEGFDGTLPRRLAECVACAVARGDGYRTGACEGYCCALEPCARPMRHNGEHSCRGCGGQTAAGGQDGAR